MINLTRYFPSFVHSASDRHSSWWMFGLGHLQFDEWFCMVYVYNNEINIWKNLSKYLCFEQINNLICKYEDLKSFKQNKNKYPRENIHFFDKCISTVQSMESHSDNFHWIWGIHAIRAKIRLSDKIIYV